MIRHPDHPRRHHHIHVHPRVLVRIILMIDIKEIRVDASGDYAETFVVRYVAAKQQDPRLCALLQIVIKNLHLDRSVAVAYKRERTWDGISASAAMPPLLSALFPCRPPDAYYRQSNPFWLVCKPNGRGACRRQRLSTHLPVQMCDYSRSRTASKEEVSQRLPPIFWTWL